MVTVGRIPQESRQQVERAGDRHPWRRVVVQRLPMLLTVVLVALALIMAAFRVTTWAQVTADDLRYGRP